MAEPNSQTFVVIEDNEPIRKLFALLLKKAGYNVYEFELGESAMEWIRQNDAHYVLCDIMLPDTSGEEVLQYVRSLSPEKQCRVVALTAFARQGDRERFLDLGFDGYIPKPINVETFVEDIFDSIQAH